MVKVARAGICGSDLTAYRLDGMSVGILYNGQFGHDGQFGHEMVGTVHEVGTEVQGVQVGDRVFVNPTVCKRNGMLGCDIAGAFSEYVLVEDAAYGYNLFKLAEEMGAVTFNSDSDGDLKEFLTAHFGGVTNPFGFIQPDVDAYLDCAGAGPILEQIVGMAKKNARISIVAIYHRPVELNAAQFLSSELTMKGSCGFDFSDAVEAFQNVNSHRTEIAKIVTHHFPHEKSVEAFCTAADRNSGAIKVVIDYDA